LGRLNAIVCAALLGSFSGLPALAQEIDQVVRQTVGMAPAERARLVCPQNDSKLCNLLLGDEAYRNKWFSVQDKLIAVEKAKAAAQASSAAEARKQQALLNIMRSNAPKLSDGRAIFQKQDGSWVDEHGRAVSDSEAFTAVWGNRTGRN